MPTAAGFSFLSWPGGRDVTTDVPAATVDGVLDAARRGFELVVVDIGRGRESLRMFAWECDRIVVVAPSQLRAAVAAARMTRELPPVETALVVRGTPRAALDAPLLADAVGLPLCGLMPNIRAVAAATETGRLLTIGRQRSVRRFAASVLDLSDGDS